MIKPPANHNDDPSYQMELPDDGWAYAEGVGDASGFEYLCGSGWGSSSGMGTSWLDGASGTPENIYQFEGTDGVGYGEDDGSGTTTRCGYGDDWGAL